MKSVQKQLTVRLLAIALVLTLGAGSLLYSLARHRFMRQFDQQLRSSAMALSSMMLREPDGKLEFDFSPVAMPEFARRSYFQIWSDDGHVVSRSPSLNNGDLLSAAPAAAGAFQLAVPGGEVGRAAAVRFTPRPDEEDADKFAHRLTPLPPLTLTLVVAQSRHEVDEVLGTLLTSLLVTAALVCVLVGVAVMLTVKQAMSPIRKLTAEVDGIGAGTLSHRFAAEQLPVELRPIAIRLNSLLDRLEQAFARERRFTADVAHELRTPIAELRSTVEVAIKWPGQSDDPQVFRDILDVSTQMETLVNALLAIARCESGVQAVRLQNVDLSETLYEAWRAHELRAEERHLSIVWDVTPSVMVKSDRALLLPMLANLLDNAASYTPTNGQIVCSLRKRQNSAELSISNTNDALTPEDVRHLFEPFWRKDSARTGGTHCGLGLSLVAAYVAALGASVRASLDDRQIFCVVITFPLAAEIETDLAAAPSGIAERATAEGAPRK
jgi:two-component system sensor histidine kinase QseC